MSQLHSLGLVLDMNERFSILLLFVEFRISSPAPMNKPPSKTKIDKLPLANDHDM
jgi:hypothetical protein